MSAPDPTPQDELIGREWLEQYFKKRRAWLVAWLCLKRPDIGFHGAEDAVQRAVLLALIEIDKGKWGHVQNPDAWFRTIAVNESRVPCRKKIDRQLSYVAPDELPDLAAKIAGPEVAIETHYLADMFDRLPVVERAIAADWLFDVPIAETSEREAIEPRQVQYLRAKVKVKVKMMVTNGKGDR